MKRFLGLLASPAVYGRFVSTSDSKAEPSNSFSSEGKSRDENDAHPLLYEVPIMASRTIGRETEVRALWQNLLSGRHFQVITGMDGIGKSTIAAEFCDCVKHSQRFTCIQWFNGQSKLSSQLQHFFASMKGRREKDVFLVIDDVTHPNEVLSLIPEHKNVYVLMTCSAADVQATTKLGVFAALPLSTASATQFASDLSYTEELQTVYENLGYVPLLMQVASLLLEGGVCGPAELLQILQTKEVMRDNTLSIQHALSVLLGISLREIAKSYPDAAAQLQKLACFHTSDISDGLIGAVVGDEAGQFAVLAAQLGIFSLKWEESAFSIHPLVAKVLRQNVTPSSLGAAADALLSLWPRRWRGAGSRVAYNLVWHADALRRQFAEHKVDMTPSLLACLDRSATFLAHVEARDLAVAVEMWNSILAQEKRLDVAPTTERVRMMRECGRLMHFLKDPRAEAVLRDAWDESKVVHGPLSAESALILGCLAPYLPATQDNVELMESHVATLQERIGSPDHVAGKEETRMLWQTIFVLLMCKGQYLTELKMPVPDSLLTLLNRVDAEVKRIK